MKEKEFRKACEELGLRVIEDNKSSFLAQNLCVRASDSNGMKSVFISYSHKDGKAKVFSYEMTTTEMISGKKTIKWFLTPTCAVTSCADMLKKLVLSQLKFLAKIQQTAKEIEIKNASLDYEEEYQSIEDFFWKNFSTE